LCYDDLTPIGGATRRRDENMAAKQPDPNTYISAEVRIRRLREAIARADDQGLSRDDLILRLTLSDVSVLKRHPSVSADEVSFAGGAMRFLGIEIASQSAPESTLAVRDAA